MIWGVLFAVTMVAGLFAALLWARRRMGAKTPGAAAQRIFRQPERCLVDLPLSLVEVPPSERQAFLLEVDRYLAAMGPLTSRRHLVQSLAEAIARPGVESGRILASSLLESPAEFQEALRWRGLTDPALDFFRVLRALSTSEDPCRIRTKLGAVFNKNKKRRSCLQLLEPRDQKIVDEWKLLLDDVLRVVDCAKQVCSTPTGARAGGKRPPRDRKEKPSIVAFETAWADLIELERNPILQPFRALAVESCELLRRSVHERG